MKLDLDKLSRGAKLIKISGRVNSWENTAPLFEEALAEVSHKQWGRLATKYFGIKHYAAFGDQREDHEYGYGPRHGTIVFSIGQANRSAKPNDEDWSAIAYVLEVTRDVGPVDVPEKYNNTWRGTLWDVWNSYYRHRNRMEQYEELLHAAVEKADIELHEI